MKARREIFSGLPLLALLTLLAGGCSSPSCPSRATPGELTWDRTLYANLALYGIVPAVTLISSQFPMLRETLFKWVDPLVKFVVSA
ncbi:MAG: hypothetical protein ABI054_14590 [Planctomycetota bacterium]